MKQKELNITNLNKKFLVQTPIQPTSQLPHLQIYILSGFDRIFLKNIEYSLLFFNALTYGYHEKKVFLVVVQNNDVKSIDYINL